jgi:hypothetical protein
VKVVMFSLRRTSRIADRWRRRELATSLLSATFRDSLRLVHEAPPRKTNGWFHLVSSATLKPPGRCVSQRRATRLYSTAPGMLPDGVCSAQDQRLVVTSELPAGSVATTTKTQSPPVAFPIPGCRLEKVALPCNCQGIPT